MKKTIFLPILILIFGIDAISQTIVAPSFILKSHETLEVMRMIRNEQGITLQMLIRNRKDAGGSFCIDKNTEIIANGLSYKIKKIENIPECPEEHKFEFFGDNLMFYLHFPPIPPETKIINVVENCNDNCFYFTGLVVDSELNTEMFIAFDYYETGMLLEGLLSYKELLAKYEGNEPEIEGLFYFYIINILKEMANREEEEKWLKRFRERNLSNSEWVEDKLRTGDNGLGF